MEAQEIIYNIKKHREYAGLSKEQVANQLGISARQYSNIENGTSELTLNRFVEVSKLINTPIEKLLGIQETYNFNNSPQSGKIKEQNNYYSEKIEQLYEQLLAEKDKQIERLKSQMNQNTK